MTRRRVTLSVALAIGLSATLLPSAPSAARPARVAAAGGIVRGDLGSGVGNPLSVARAALAAKASELGVDASAFRFETVRRSIVGVHVRGREFRGGVPVEATFAAVHVVRGRIWQVEARPSRLPGGPSAVAIPRAAAVTAALHSLGTANSIVPAHAERLLVESAGRLIDAWRVDVVSMAPAVAGTAVIDAATGRTVEVHDRRRFANGTATVFDPNPMVTKRDPSLREPGVDAGGVDTDLDSAELNAELRPLPVLGYDASQLLFGRLVGPWVDVQGPAPLLPGGNFSFTRGDPRFEATMAYAHIDRLQRYFQSLGFIGAAAINAEPQTVLALVVPGYDQSFYQPGNDLILYGSGGVDDAEDAEIILHEYGHAVHDAQVPGWGNSHEGGSMGEGWGDFLAASYYALGSGGFQDPCVGEWDATSYSTTEPPCLRRTDTDKHYPEDMEGEVHADGEIWSSFLWRVRNLLGCVPLETGCKQRSAATVASIKTSRVLKLVLTSHEFLGPDADFGDAVRALIMAAKAINPKWGPPVVVAARERGLPRS